MVSPFNVNEPYLGYQNWNTTQLSIFSGYVKWEALYTRVNIWVNTIRNNVDPREIAPTYDGSCMVYIDLNTSSNTHDTLSVYKAWNPHRYLDGGSKKKERTKRYQTNWYTPRQGQFTLVYWIFIFTHYIYTYVQVVCMSSVREPCNKCHGYHPWLHLRIYIYILIGTHHEDICLPSWLHLYDLQIYYADVRWVCHHLWRQ